jgi:ABC-type enterobactin transport system permease subunit
MTGAYDGVHVTVVAHHSLLLALPAFAPAIVVAGVVVYIASKNRKKREANTESRNDD